MWAWTSAPPIWGVGVDPDVDAGTVPQHFSLWVYVDDCDRVVETLRAAGASIIEEPVDQSWGEPVARVADPDGNVVIIGAKTG